MNVTISPECNPPEKPGQTLFNPDKVCEAVNIFRDRVEIIWRIKSGRVLLSHPPRKTPDTVFKDIYNIKVDNYHGGHLRHFARIDGRIEPEVITPEKIVFDEK